MIPFPNMPRPITYDQLRYAVNLGCEQFWKITKLETDK